MKWPFTFVVPSLPNGVGASSSGPVIRILEKYKDDEGVYQHELRHVNQWLVVSALFAAVIATVLFCTGSSDWFNLAFAFAADPLLYTLIPMYKLHMEIDAYRVQALYYEDDRLPRFAQFIATRYGLNVSEDEALKMLRQ